MLKYQAGIVIIPAFFMPVWPMPCSFVKIVKRIDRKKTDTGPGESGVSWSDREKSNRQTGRRIS